MLALQCPASQPLARPGIIKETRTQTQVVATLLATGDDANRIRVIVDDLRARYPGVENAEIVNYLMAAYCPVVAQLSGLGEQEKQAAGADGPFRDPTQPDHLLTSPTSGTDGNRHRALVIRTTP